MRTALLKVSFSWSNKGEQDVRTNRFISHFKVKEGKLEDLKQHAPTHGRIHPFQRIMLQPPSSAVGTPPGTN
jgi:hypothetical protein